ncbi:MAG: Transcriptional regulator, LysR family [uncultured Caballeronia sp.]|nr:MAG: Transcriptional regulator, LysR family [uncultured Caballeronia sp.]
MDYTLLRAFLTVAREGNLTRAAARLHLTQPAVSLQIKNLQEMLGVVLRTSHGLLLTRDGEALLPHAERTLAVASDIQRAAAALRHEVSGTLHIGTILDPGFLRLGGFLRQLVETHPRIETSLRHGMSGWVLDVRFHVVRLTPFIYRVLAPAGWHNRVNKGKRSWAALAKLPWIWTPPESAHNRLLSRIFREVGAMPVIVAEVDQEPSMLDLVKSGVGLTLARDSIAIGEAHAHALTIVEGVTVPTQRRSFHLSRWRSAARNRRLRRLRLIDAPWAV